MTRLQAARKALDDALDARGHARTNARERVDREFAAIIAQRVVEYKDAGDEAVSYGYM